LEIFNIFAYACAGTLSAESSTFVNFIYSHTGKTHTYAYPHTHAHTLG